MEYGDASYRKLFAHKELMRDLLACVLDAALFERLDWARMAPLSTTYVAEHLRQRTGDAAWRIPYKAAGQLARQPDGAGPPWGSDAPSRREQPDDVGPSADSDAPHDRERAVHQPDDAGPSTGARPTPGEPTEGAPAAGGRCLYVLLLFEHQSRSDAVMALRMAVYAGLLYESLLRSERLAPPLPPILPVVFYSGTPPWRAASDLGGLLETVPAGLRPYQLGMRYLLVAERDLLAASSLPDRNLAALVLRMGRSDDLEQWRSLLHTLRQVVRGPGFEELDRGLTSWLTHTASLLAQPSADLPPVTNLEDLEMEISERTGLWARQWKQEGVQQGMQQGMRQGQSELLLRLVVRRFGPISEGVAERIRSADASLLEQWALNVLDATTLDEVFR